MKDTFRRKLCQVFVENIFKDLTEWSHATSRTWNSAPVWRGPVVINMADGNHDKSPPTKRSKITSASPNKSDIGSKFKPKASSPVKTVGSPEKLFYFKNINAIVVDKGLGKTRTSVLIKQLVRHGGTHHDSLQESTTHILVDRTMKIEKLCTILKVKSIPADIAVVNADWLSSCLSESKVKNCEDFLISKSASKSKTSSDFQTTTADAISNNSETEASKIAVVCSPSVLFLWQNI